MKTKTVEKFTADQAAQISNQHRRVKQKQMADKLEVLAWKGLKQAVKSGSNQYTIYVTKEYHADDIHSLLQSFEDLGYKIADKHPYVTLSWGNEASK